MAPSERITLGGIGIGNRGEFDLNWMLPEPDVQFVAICDARKERREAVKKIVDKHYGNSDCKMYPDMREFLAARGGHRRAADRHRRPLARDGVDHGHAGGQGRLLREALLHDDRRGPRRGRDGPALRPDLPDRHPAAQRGQLRRRHRDGPNRPARQGAHRAGPHRPVGRRRDVATRGCPPSPNLPRKRSTGTPGSAPARGGPTTRPTSAAAGGATTTSTRAASASGVRTPSPSRRRGSTP